MSIWRPDCKSRRFGFWGMKLFDEIEVALRLGRKGGTTQLLISFAVRKPGAGENLVSDSLRILHLALWKKLVICSLYLRMEIEAIPRLAQ